MLRDSAWRESDDLCTETDTARRSSTTTPAG
jgi:hypothetical protein